MTRRSTKLAILFGSAAVLASFILMPSARSADVVVEEDPAPPEPVTEAVSSNAWYIAGRIGGAFGDDTEFSTLGTRVVNAYDTGYNFSGAVGYEFRTDSPVSMRTEAEIGYTSLEVKNHNVVGVGSFSGANAFGDASSLYALVNGYVDYEIGALTPFVGAGVGYGQVKFDVHGTTATGLVMNDRDNGVAWQVGGGAAYSVTDSLKLDLGYRYFGIEDVGLTATDGTSSSTDIRSHQITLGIRKAF